MCLSTTDRAQSEGVCQHQGQGTEWGCVSTTDRGTEAVGCLSTMDRAQRRWGCVSTMDRTHGGGGGVSAPGTGHGVGGGGCLRIRDRAHGGGVSASATGRTGLYPQARGNEPESSKMLRAAGVGHSCATAIERSREGLRPGGLQSLDPGSAPWLEMPRMQQQVWKSSLPHPSCLTVINLRLCVFFLEGCRCSNDRGHTINMLVCFTTTLWQVLQASLYQPKTGSKRSHGRVGST